MSSELVKLLQVDAWISLEDSGEWSACWEGLDLYTYDKDLLIAQLRVLILQRSLKMAHKALKRVQEREL